MEKELLGKGLEPELRLETEPREDAEGETKGYWHQPGPGGPESPCSSRRQDTSRPSGGSKPPAASQKARSPTPPVSRLTALPTPVSVSSSVKWAQGDHCRSTFSYVLWDCLTRSSWCLDETPA